MGIDAFVVEFDLEGKEFAGAFLASSDFEIPGLREINKEFGLFGGSQKNTLIEHISNASKYNQDVQSRIVEHLVTRNKRWMSIKIGEIKEFPKCGDPNEIVTSMGREEWYGPISNPNDDVTARWYIRPVHIKHWLAKEIGNSKQLFQVHIRWLCFARLQ